MNGVMAGVNGVIKRVIGWLVRKPYYICAPSGDGTRMEVYYCGFLSSREATELAEKHLKKLGFAYMFCGWRVMPTAQTEVDLGSVLCVASGGAGGLAPGAGVN